MALAREEAVKENNGCSDLAVALDSRGKSAATRLKMESCPLLVYTLQKFFIYMFCHVKPREQRKSYKKTKK